MGVRVEKEWSRFHNAILKVGEEELEREREEMRVNSDVKRI